MHIKSITIDSPIAGFAGGGSVSGHITYAADTAALRDTPFTVLIGIAASQMSLQELPSCRGSGAASTLNSECRYHAL